MVAPCKECTKRYLGCHSECEKYKEYDLQNKKRREERYLRGRIEWSESAYNAVSNSLKRDKKEYHRRSSHSD